MYSAVSNPHCFFVVPVWFVMVSWIHFPIKVESGLAVQSKCVYHNDKRSSSSEAVAVAGAAAVRFVVGVPYMGVGAGPSGGAGAGGGAR